MPKVKEALKWMTITTLVASMAGCNTLTKTVSVMEDGAACRQISEAGMHRVKGPIIQSTGAGVVLSNKPIKSVDAASEEDENYWTVRVDMGAKPTAGYGLKLVSEKLVITDQTARFALQWVEPEPGSMQAQMISYPCLYLKVEKGDYEVLEAVDPSGVVVHRLSLP
ncbi:MAG: protease complex subunit PrcB family protein [Candidatus Thiodiazotropha sp.]